MFLLFLFQMISLPHRTNLPINSCHPDLENIDPNPDVHQLFSQFDQLFFQNLLQNKGTVVRWSTRMTLCAGTCSFDGISNTIALSKPLLSLRPRSDLVNTLLHEMIHAYLFLTLNIRRRAEDGRDGHGPHFQAQMHRINKLANSNITIYHTFHDEVDAQRKHVWKCDGICQTWKPYYGICKRSMNRPPQKADNWFARHEANCGGTFHKIAGPDMEKDKGKNKENIDPKSNTKSNSKSKKSVQPSSKSKNITDFFPKVSTSPKKEESTTKSENIGLFQGQGKSLKSEWKTKRSRLIDEFDQKMKISKKNEITEDEVIVIDDFDPPRPIVKKDQYSDEVIVID